MVSRVDLHVHSKYSNRPGEWWLRQIGTPESFTEPAYVYQACRDRGMDYVTISDHDTIDGALEIAHLPGTFLSSEITTSFPEDGCQVHCLVIGVTEAQFREIDRLRENIYDFRRYLFDENVIYSVAHPLFRVNDKLTLEHFEKLLVMFKRFEAINGARDPRAGELARAIFENLTPDLLAELADRHDLDPEDAEPWRKVFTGGSDDHSGLYVAAAYTETPVTADVEEFLGHLAAGNHRQGGEHGSSLKLARSFYSIAYRFYRQRLGDEARGRGDFFAELMNRVLENDHGGDLPRADRWLLTARKFFLPKKRLGEVELNLVSQLEELFTQRRGEAPLEVEQRCFKTASALGQQLSCSALRKLLDSLQAGKITEALESVSGFGPVTLAVAPYLAAFHTQHKDERMLQAVAEHFHQTRPLRRKSEKKAWFTDTFAEINGVARTIQTCAAIARRYDKGLAVITSQRAEVPEGLPVTNFPPVDEFALPEYEELRLSFPPFLEILETCEREAFSEIIISTPGPLGLVALAAGRLLGLRVTGIYHTDFPLYARHLTGSRRLEELTWGYMRWFFDQMDTLYAPSRFYLDRLVENGFDRQRLRVLPRGVDRQRFHPGHRTPGFWRAYGLKELPTFVYVGRVSKEKNLEALLNAFNALLGEGRRAQLAVVGDGPHLEELKSAFTRPEVVFTGFLEGDELARAYASSDVFVFPSTTDTFGNVVLEALASGLPAIVTDRGGPREIVEPDAGLIVDLRVPGSLHRAMRSLLTDEPRRRRLAEQAQVAARDGSWEALFEELWQEKVTARDEAELQRHRSIQEQDRELIRVAG